MPNNLAWIEDGKTFGFDDLVFWQGKGVTPFAAVAAQIDTIVFGPHAVAAFPAELRPHVSPQLTLRKQCDYSDVITAPLGRAWAAADPHVVYVENPHSRAVLDANRPPVADVGPGLRQFFTTLARSRAGEKVSYAGIDNVRPITFGGETVLMEPQSDAEWDALVSTLNDCAARGPQNYVLIRDGLVNTVLASRPAGRHLHLISLHDTMNTQMQPDGAITRERPVADRLPWFANFGNRGDAEGNGPADELSIPGIEMRRIADAWTHACDITDQGILLNSPYKGAWETMHWGERLRALGEPNVGIVQVEFLRETLLGEAATAELHEAGTGWPLVDAAHLTGIVAKLKSAGDSLRKP